MEGVSTGPRVTAELVADMQERILALLSDGRCRRISDGSGELMFAILSDLQLPRNWDESKRNPGLPSIRRVEVCVAVAEAAIRLIGLGLAVQCEGGGWEPTVHLQYAYVTERGEVAEGSRDDGKLIAPLAIRLSTYGLELVRDGSIAIRNPDLYLTGLDPISPRVTAVLREALETYRRDLPLATVTLLGVACEAAWRDVGLELATRWLDGTLEAQLEHEAPYRAVLEAIERKGIDGKQLARTCGMRPEKLRTLGYLFADLRNEAVHEVITPLPIDMAQAATMLYQARDYFEAIGRLRGLP